MAARGSHELAVAGWRATPNSVKLRIEKELAKRMGWFVAKAEQMINVFFSEISGGGGGNSGNSGSGSGGSNRSNLTNTPKGRKITTHACESLLRHGFKEPFGLVDEIIDNYSRKTIQNDGATVFIKISGGRQRKYDIVIVGNQGIVTGLRNLSRKELENLGRRYGFNPNP